MYDPLFTASRNGTTVLSWWVMDREGHPPGRRARAMLEFSPTRNGRVVELDADVKHVTPIFGPTAFPIWLTEHVTSTGGGELRFIRDSAGSASTLATMASPFTGPFAASALSRTEILVAGPLFHADSAHPRLVSLLIRARVECGSSAP